ncbi:hypothetical protein D917_03062 [Trichinella nativa]|uniref:Uncharacterized protein n=1 Tax=Trichinella nativa TaxID=6335 RepID=A0A1Y3EFD0_9BILA|nr:hypothetical protein D917_03062 [Trichinella nativa]
MMKTTNTSAQLKLSIQLLHCGHCSSLG